MLSTNGLLKQNTYVYDLPSELIATLTGKDAGHSITRPSADDDRGSDSDDTARGATSCGLCGVTYDEQTTQKSHVRSDLHRYNLKLKIRHQKPVSEAEFEKLIEDIDESISGSDSSTDEDDEESKDDMLTSLLRKQINLSGHQQSVDAKAKAPGSPYFWFGSNKLEESISIGVFKSLFTFEEQDERPSLVDSLKLKQLSAENSVKDRHFFLCMIGGGHFAGMLVSLAPKKHKKSNPNERELDVLAHKTFHRYTTRRKQGGAQSAKDNATGKAHSAGANLRRYNEAALRSEVRELLDEWRDLIDAAELLFIRATGAHNRRTLFGPYDDQVLSLRDRRLRGFPFNTKRATQNELVRSFNKLTTVNISRIDHAALAAAEEAAAAKQREAAAALERAQATSSPSKLSKEDIQAEAHTAQIVNMINRNRIPVLMSYLHNNSLTPEFRFYPPNKHYHAPTMLHLAASKNSAGIITSLLVSEGANPTTINGQGKTAYELCGTRASRDAFRVARYDLGEEKWDWTAARVGDAMSHETLKQREAAEQAELDEAARKRREELEAERKKVEAEPVPAKAGATKNSGSSLLNSIRNSAATAAQLGGGRILGSIAATGSQADAEKGLSDEMKRKLEREKRARAMEARLGRTQQGSGSGTGQ